MDLNFSVFQEPRGVMRIFHFVFSICAFATTVDYGGYINLDCVNFKYTYSYPFNLNLNREFKVSTATPECSARATAIGDFSSDSGFFVATGILAMLYAVGIIIVYIKFDKSYKNNDKLPLTDFVLSVVLTILWLSASAAWANGLSGLKNATDPNNIGWDQKCPCDITSSSFGSLNISVIFGFLNFFLWSADLWFLYKETKWFQKPAAATEGM